MGIYQVQLAGLDTVTNGVADGYQNYSCRTGATLQRGTTFTLRIRTNPSADETVRAWIDFDDNGQFAATEQVLASTARQHQAVFTVPLTASINRPFRLRVAADYVNAPIPTPCSTSQYSQTEDYYVTVSATSQPHPTARFVALDTVTCGTPVAFRDQSLNAPTTWRWTFGDGSNSAQQQPTHTYASPGKYAVSLRVCNATGCDSVTKPNYIIVQADGPRPASCMPATTSYCCGFGITRVRLGTLNHVSSDGAAGYQDFSCAHRVTLTADRPTTLQLTTGPNAHDVRVYLDVNDNGVFELPGELFYQGVGVQNPMTVLQIPATTAGIVYNRPLRLRLWADASSATSSGPCTTPQRGQIEDYSVTILPNAAAPTAQFSTTCTQFCRPTRLAVANSTIGGATSYQWDFGDGTNSTLASPPEHTYTTAGIYYLSLVARNAMGTDTMRQTVVVARNCPTYCTPSGSGGSASSPAFFTRVQLGTLDNTDTRAPGGVAYRDFTARSVALQQGQQYTIRAESLPYSFSGSGPYVRVTAWLDYNQDGFFSLTERVGHVVTLSPHLMTFRVPLNAPVGATRLRLRINTYGQNLDPTIACPPNSAGFTASSEDYTVLIMPAEQTPRTGFTVNQSPACNGTVQFTDTTQAGPAQWQWAFGDGMTSTQQHPQHTYAQPGTYQVSLTTRNRYGAAAFSRSFVLTATSQGPRPAACLPPSNFPIDAGLTDWEVSRIEISSWIYTNPNRLSGYQDETCAVPSITLAVGVATPIAVRLINYNSIFPTWVQLWLDANDDGVFDPISELVYNSYATTSSPSGPWLGSLIVPATAMRNRPLRLRYWSFPTFHPANLAGQNLPCVRNEYAGQVRDFTVIISSPLSTIPPSASSVTNWAIYPNPVTTHQPTLVTHFRSGQNIELQAYDVMGRIVFKTQLTIGTDGKSSFSLPALLQGVYTIQVVGEKGLQRIIIP